MILRTVIAGIAGLLFSGCDGRGKLVEHASFVVAGAFSDTGIGISCEEVVWATDSVLIATARNKRIQAFDANSGKELWSKEFDKSIEAVTCNSDHVYVALDASYPHEDAESIRCLDVANGKDSTPKGIPQPFLVQALVWSPELKALCILQNEALWIYSADLLAVANRIPYSGRLPTVTSDGKSVLLAEQTGSCTLIDLKAGSTMADKPCVRLEPDTTAPFQSLNRPVGVWLAPVVAIRSAQENTRTWNMDFILYNAPMKWEDCSAVERRREVVSGAWVFVGSRIPVAALFENLEDGATVDEFLEWFPGISRKLVDQVLSFTAASPLPSVA